MNTTETTTKQPSEAALRAAHAIRYPILPASKRGENWEAVIIQRAIDGEEIE